MVISTRHIRRPYFHPFVLICRLLLLLFLCVLASCSKPVELPVGWTGNIFKLTEHPEAFDGYPQEFFEAKGQLTINDDTRQGFLLQPGGLLKFHVNIPSDSILKLALGKPESNAAEAAGEIEIMFIAGHRGGYLYTGEVSDGNWSDLRIEIPKGFEGEGLLSFLSVKGKGGEDVFIAHPYLVTPTNDKPKRVIWITVDTLRADHLGAYGYERETSPNIDEFAEDGLLFERCISVSPWTFPSYASMFTGRYPSITGATTGVWSLPDEETTLAEIVSSKDFVTFCISNIIWLNEGTSLNQGFDSLKWFVLDYADVSFDLAKDWLKKHPDEDCFLMIHLVDPHVPYKPKPEYRDTFDPGYYGRYKYDFPNFSPVWSGETRLADDEKHHLEALYDELILGCDADIGSFLDFLKAEDIYDDTFIIFNSDHGEEFWEHGGFEHGHQLYDEVLKVPMIIRGPGIPRGRRVGGICSNIDIFPTILEWLEIDVPEAINAVSLFDLERGDVEPESRMLLSEQLYHGTEQKGVSTDKYRYILHTINKIEELYDIREDPMMLADVAKDRRSSSRNFRYFTTEYMLNENAGWHVRFFRHPLDETGGLYEGVITAESGFSSVDGTRLGDEDEISVSDEGIVFSIYVENWDNKAFDFKTNNEEDLVSFRIEVDGAGDADGLIFVGPLKKSYEPVFELSILDPLFGLGQPLFGPIELNIQTGMFIWGLSETLREKSSPEIDDRTREELRSLGYLR